MAMEEGDIIQLTAVSTYQVQSILNVFHYEVLENQETYDPSFVTAAFASDIWNAVRAILVSSTTLVRVDFKNLTNGIDIYSGSFNIAGSVTGEGLPPFVAYSFRLNRTTGLTRHGHKRFCGVPETLQANGVINAGALTDTTQIAAVLGSDLVEDTQTTRNFRLAPVIIGRDLQQDGSYVLNLSKINPVQSGQYVNISSQSSRKFGRGI